MVTPAGVEYEEFCRFHPPEIVRLPAPVTARAIVPVVAMYTGKLLNVVAFVVAAPVAPINSDP